MIQDTTLVIGSKHYILTGVINYVPNHYHHQDHHHHQYYNCESHHRTLAPNTLIGPDIILLHLNNPTNTENAEIHSRLTNKFSSITKTMTTCTKVTLQAVEWQTNAIMGLINADQYQKQILPATTNNEPTNKKQVIFQYQKKKENGNCQNS